MCVTVWQCYGVTMMCYCDNGMFLVRNPTVEHLKHWGDLLTIKFLVIVSNVFASSMIDHYLSMEDPSVNSLLTMAIDITRTRNRYLEDLSSIQIRI